MIVDQCDAYLHYSPETWIGLCRDCPRIALSLSVQPFFGIDTIAILKYYSRNCLFHSHAKRTLTPSIHTKRCECLGSVKRN